MIFYNKFNLLVDLMLSDDVGMLFTTKESE